MCLSFQTRLRSAYTSAVICSCVTEEKHASRGGKFHLFQFDTRYIQIAQATLDSSTLWQRKMSNSWNFCVPWQIDIDVEKILPTNCECHHSSGSYDYEIDLHFPVMYKDCDEQECHLENVTSAIKAYYRHFIQPYFDAPLKSFLWVCRHVVNGTGWLPQLTLRGS